MLACVKAWPSDAAAEFLEEEARLSEVVSITYRLGQNGWSDFQLNVGADSVVVGPFGYCSDALGDLVRAGLMVATSGFEAKVSFDGEPTEWRLAIGSYWDANLKRWSAFCLRVFRFQFLASPLEPETEGAKIFEAQCAPEQFAKAVLKSAKAIWNEYGSDGYDKIWSGPRGFPLRALIALEAALSAEEPRTD